MIEIDGSEGEGGGQIIRTAVALSALTGKPVSVSNIRAKRNNPGLAAQHLACIKGVQEICSGKVEGCFVGSKKISFFPGKVKGGKYSIDVGTAGSISLVLQGVMLASLASGDRIECAITGGTNVAWSPPTDYIKNVMLPILSKFGYRGELEIISRGFYPAGGGKVKFIYEPSKLLPTRLTERGKLESIQGIACVSNLPEEISIRMKHAFLKEVPDAKIKSSKEASLSPGAFLCAWANFSNTVIGADSLGERGKPSEQVGKEAGEKLKLELSRNACVDSHMCDQIVPYLAYAGGEVKTGSLTSHAKANLEVTRLFFSGLDYRDGILFRTHSPVMSSSSSAFS